MKKYIALLLAAVMMFSSVSIVYASDEVTTITWGDDKETEKSEGMIVDLSQSKPYLALGADLNEQQLATVLSLMGLVGQDLSNYNIVYVTNAMEHEYLDQYVDPTVIGKRALSSVLVRSAQKGHGVQVTTQNINYCTVGMYKNALLTAGVEDADILVVGPTSISGTAALIGALKAYEEMSGEKVTDQAIDTALDELVTTGEIADETGDSEEISELIAFIKAEIAGRDLETEEDIEEAVRQAVKDYGVELSEEEIHRIVELMIKIKELGIDYDTLLSQAEDLYAKFGDKLSLDNINDISNDTKVEIAKAVVGKFFSSIFEGVSSFFKGIFGK